MTQARVFLYMLAFAVANAIWWIILVLGGIVKLV